MELAKPSVDEKEVQDFITRKFSASADSLIPLKGGIISQAFSFSRGGEGFIIRVNDDNEGYLKDQYAYQNFRSDALPIPEVLLMDEIREGLFGCITKKVEGQIFETLDKETRLKLMPQVLETLDAIHEVDISNTEGFGPWNADGNAKFENFEEHVRDRLIRTGVRHHSFEWSHILAETSMEKDLYERTKSKIEEFLAHLPEKRFLIHGDYGYDNLLCTEEKITGAIDWCESRYGDFLEDIAWLAYWSKDIPYAEIAKAHYREQGREVPQFDERILCYKLCTGLGCMGFSALLNDHKEYELDRNRVISMLE